MEGASVSMDSTIEKIRASERGLTERLDRVYLAISDLDRAVDQMSDRRWRYKAIIVVRHLLSRR